MSVTTNVTGRKAVISAAASGIGRATTIELVQGGAHVIAADIDEAALDDLAAHLKDSADGRLECIRCDIADPADVSRLAAFASDRFGAPDLLFNHAGISAAGRFEDIPMDAWERVLRINVLGTVQMMQAFMPAMVERGSGHIVNTASAVALFLDSPLHAAYAASKSAIVAMSRCAALQVKDSGVRVSVFCPDYTQTGFFRFATLHGLTLDEFRAKATPGQPQRPEDVARSLLAQLDDSGFIISMAPQTGERMHALVDEMLDPT